MNREDGGKSVLQVAGGDDAFPAPGAGVAAVTTVRPTIEAVRAELARIERQRAAERSGRRLPPADHCWLALTPSWTVSVAKLCHFPTPEGTTTEMLFASLQENGLLEKLDLFVTGGKRVATFAMDPAARAEVVEAMLAASDGSTLVRMTLQSVGRQVSGLAAAAVLPQVSRWAQLAAQAADPAKLVAHFDQEINNAIDHGGDVVTALEWMDAARPLAGLLARTLDTGLKVALERAGRRLDLVRRAEHDRRQLVDYLDRPDAIAAFDRLMDGPDERWALHFIGVGGMGKTMTIRDIMVRSTQPPRRLAVARVDFDLVNPDFPRLAPGLLLSHFATELVNYDQSGRTSELVAKAERILRDLHQRLRLDGQGIDRQAMDSRELRAAFRLLLDAFRALDRRILLVIDTCEELTRVRPDGTRPEGLEEMFRLLRALHDGPMAFDDDGGNAGGAEGLPSLRVIFSGRRPLATAGAGWRLAGVHGGAASLPERPFLALHQIGGFPREEARGYLARTLKVPANLTEPILDKTTLEASSSTGMAPVASEIIWDDRREGQHPGPSVSPYELRFFADWARDDPPPSPEAIRSANADRYVETRIVGRIEYQQLRDLLPVLTQMGHFHESLLKTISDLDEAHFEILFDELLQQEWIVQRLQPDASGGTRLVLSVAPASRQRMSQYFRQRPGTSGMLARAAGALESLTLDRPLEELDWTTFDAAMRVLQDEPLRAASWWARIEERILADRTASWALRLTRALTSAEGAAGSSERSSSPLRAAVLAFHAGALAHAGDAAGARAAWCEVAAELERHCGIPRPRQLAFRASAGRIANAAPNDPLPPGLLDEWWREVAQLEGPLAPAVLAAVLAALEALVERAEELVDRHPASARQLLTGAADTEMGSPGIARLSLLLGDERVAERAVRRFGSILVARALAIFARETSSMGEVRRLLDENVVDAGGSTRRGAEDRRAPLALDWRPPEDLPARVELELVRLAYPALMSAGELLRRLREPPDLGTIDGDRLASAHLGLRLALDRSARAELASLLPTQPGTLYGGGPPHIDLDDMRPFPDDLESLRQRMPAGSARCRAHRETPPLVARVAEALVAAGRADEAMAPLYTIASHTSSFEVDVRLAAERALLSIQSQLRLWNRPPASSPSTLLSTSGRDQDRELWMLAQAQQEASPPADVGADDPRDLHRVWRTARLVPGDPGLVTLETAMRFGAARLSQESSYPETSGAAMDLTLDCAEIAMMKGRPVEIDKIAEWTLRLPPGQLRSENMLRWALRFSTLTELPLSPSGFDLYVARLGRRRCAEIAYEEAERLALRLPTQAAELYSLAHDWYDERDMGRLLAATACAQHGDRSAALARLEAAYASVSRPVDWPAWETLSSPYPASRNRDAWSATLARIQSCLVRRPARGDVAARLKILLQRMPLATQLLGPDTATPLVASAPALWARRLGLAGLAAIVVLSATLVVVFRWQTLKESFSSNSNQYTGLGLMVALRLLSRWRRLPLVVRVPIRTLFVLSLLGFMLFVTLLDDSRTVVAIALGLAMEEVFSWGRYWASFALSRSALYVRPTVRWDGAAVTITIERGSERHRLALNAQQLDWPPNAPRWALAERIAPAVAAWLRRRRWWVSRNTIPVTIEGSPEIHRWPWEATLWLSLSKLPQKSRCSPFRYRRRLLRVHQVAAPSLARADTIKVVAPATSALSRELLKVAWRPALRSRRYDIRLAAELDRKAPGVHVVHLVGSVEETSSGLRFRLQVDPAIQGAGVAELAPEEVCARFPNAHICLLQGIALRTARDRLDSDRHDASLVRGFAAAMLAAGMPAIVVIPPVAADEAAALTRIVVDAVRTRAKNGEMRLTEAMSVVQSRIVERLMRDRRTRSYSIEEADRRDAWEVALDASLFLGAEWDGRLALLPSFPFSLFAGRSR